MHFKIIVLFIINFTVVKTQFSEGDGCTVSRTGGRGTCKIITNCQSVIDDLRRKRFPTVCGYEGRYQIVCCPIPATPPPSIRPTPLLSEARISIKKCNEYTQAIYEKQYINTPFNDEPVEKNVSTCGFTTVPLIVGGTAAGSREFPHMALIGYQDGNKILWGCGGSLISDEFILTAGHCILTRDYGAAKYAKLGDLVLNGDSDDADPIDVGISDAIKHPNYRLSTNYNDIGLLRLERKITFNRYIRPACLHDAYESGTHNAIATGWGLVEWNGKKSDTLLKVVLELFSYQECNRTFRYDVNRRLRDGIIDRTQFCAGSHVEAKDTCQGDSGGPLQIYNEQYGCMYSVVGVTSFGKACGLVGNPGVYTRVFAYLDWIESIVWPNQ